MASTAILWPVVALVALSFVVLGLTARERLLQLKRNRVHPQAVAMSAQMAAHVADSRCADNFRNLFELPVLFYIAMLTAFVTAQGGALVTGLAWAFVILRVAHSVVHCGSNKVRHRFAVFALGAAVLAVLWARLAVGLLG
jgi:hypothetical protein